MKKVTIFILALVITLSFIISTATAMPIGNSNGERRYAFTAHNMQNWSLGVFYRTVKREIDIEGQASIEWMKSGRAGGYVGYSPLPSVMIYAISAGSSDKVKHVRGVTRTSDGNEFGAGVHFNLLSHELLDPTLVEDKFRLNAVLQYTLCNSSWYLEDLEWSETYACLKASIVNDIYGSKFFYPNSIALFGGPIYSDLSGDINEKKTTGFTYGLEVFYTENLFFSLGVENIKHQRYNAGVHLIF